VAASLQVVSSQLLVVSSCADFRDSELLLGSEIAMSYCTGCGGAYAFGVDADGFWGWIV
jgi:hypothetical protein